MCGINIIFKENDARISRMSDATAHRGTTSAFEYVGGATVEFRLLRITDESRPGGSFTCGDTTVYLNGYISNHLELKEKYGFKTRTNCDTEVLAAFLDRFGGSKLNELNGFFAVAYYTDDLEGAWRFFTDRYGIKQLYTYVDSENTRFISSEIKGILAACPEIEISKQAEFDWQYSLGVVGEETLYKGVKRIAKLAFIVPAKVEIAYPDAVKQLKALWARAVERNRYDGLSGVYLSGGIDSGIITNSFKPDYSFSMDYLDNTFSEIDLIKENSQGTHLTIICNPELVAKYSLKTMGALDDLKAGSSYTNFAIAELASKFVKVVYSGAGGDEFFGGYPHRKNKKISEVICRTGTPYRKYEMSHFEYDLKFLDAILVVEDRMGGFHTMETRYPLLDNDLVDFAMSLPDEYLEGKKILKEISNLSENVLKGGKKGFSNPYFTNTQWADFCLNNLKKY